MKAEFRSVIRWQVLGWCGAIGALLCLCSGCGKGAPGQERVSNATEMAGRDAIEPILHLPMDDGAPSIALLCKSTSGTGETPFAEKDPAKTRPHTVPGMLGTALALNGSDDSFVVTDDRLAANFSAGKDFSVSFWWRSDTENFPNGYTTILSTVTLDKGGIALFQRGNAEGTFRRLYMNFYAGGQGAPLVSCFVESPAGGERWHHYVFQRQGTTLQAWRDGRLLDSHSEPMASSSMGSEHLKLGAPDSGAVGALDDVKVYSYAISKVQILRQASPAASTDDVFLLAEELNEVRATQGASASAIEECERAVQAAIDSDGGYPIAIGSVAELLAFRYRYIENNEYEMGFVFRVNSKIKEDHFLHVRGFVDPSNRIQMEKSAGQSVDRQKWEIVPERPTSTWNPGDVIVVRGWVKAKHIPYRMELNFISQSPEHSPLLSRYVQLGWHAALDETS